VLVLHSAPLNLLTPASLVFFSYCFPKQFFVIGSGDFFSSSPETPLKKAPLFFFFLGFCSLPRSFRSAKPAALNSPAFLRDARRKVTPWVASSYRNFSARKFPGKKMYRSNFFFFFAYWDPTQKEGLPQRFKISNPGCPFFDLPSFSFFWTFVV